MSQFYSGQKVKFKGDIYNSVIANVPKIGEILTIDKPYTGSVDCWMIMEYPSGIMGDTQWFHKDELKAI